MTEGLCPLCGEQAMVEPCAVTVVYGEHGERRPRVTDSHVECERCGHYDIEGSFGEAIAPAREEEEPSLTLGLLPREVREKYLVKLHLISGLTKTHWVSTGKPLRLTRERLDDLFASERVPKTPAQCVDRLVTYLGGASDFYGERRELNAHMDYPVAFARHADELRQFLGYMEDAGLVKNLSRPLTTPTLSCVLTMAGWQRAEELARTSAHSTQAFVATWFDSEMDHAYRDGIDPALKDTGWEPLWLKLTKDSGKIDDQITAGIMQSGLVVADFTGHRPSVYFEAGLAKGLGIPVILTCRKDHKDSEDAGFDTEHYRHIFWEEPTDLHSKLVDFIGAMGLDRTKALPPGMREEQ